MNFFQSVRLHFFRKKVLRALAEQQRQRRTHTIWSARSVGILFDATLENDRREVLKFAKGLEKDGRALRLLGYFHASKVVENQPFECFSRKETTWLGLAQGEKTAAFAREKFDLLLVFNLAGRLPLEWLAARSQAAMKIGPATDNPNDLDLALDTPAGRDVLFFLTELDRCLDCIVLPAREGAVPQKTAAHRSPTTVATA